MDSKIQGPELPGQRNMLGGSRKFAIPRCTAWGTCCHINSHKAEAVIHFKIVHTDRPQNVSAA